MFPFALISRAFLRNLIQCAEKFAKIQMHIIERNIRLFPRTHDPELKKQFEYIQEKVVERYIKSYEVKPIPLTDTVVRVPYRRNEVSTYLLTFLSETKLFLQCLMSTLKS